MDNLDYKAMQAKALEQLRSGQSLTGKDGVFGPLLKEFLETALEAEMASHLDEIERSQGNILCNLSIKSKTPCHHLLKVFLFLGFT